MTNQLTTGQAVTVQTELGPEDATVRSIYNPGAGDLVTVEFADRTRYVFPANVVTPKD